jgi:hypothetical protein
MTKSTDNTATTESVSTVTKHITIYSDNPIHDCIDRIIDACSALDEGTDRQSHHADLLYVATTELLELASDRLDQAIYLENRRMNE